MYQSMCKGRRSDQGRDLDPRNPRKDVSDRGMDSWVALVKSSPPGLADLIREFLAEMLLGVIAVLGYCQGGELQQCLVGPYHALQSGVRADTEKRRLSGALHYGLCFRERH